MNIEHRRSERILDFLPIAVSAVDGTNGLPVAEPFAGNIIDISKHGACLLMPLILHNGFHLFHSTRDTANTLLQVTINHPPDLGQCILTAVPIWMDLFRKQEIRAFKMGIEFTENPEINQMKALQKALHQNQEERGSWWRRQYLLWRKSE